MMEKNETVAHKLTLRFAFALDSSNSVAGTDQSAAQIRPFPLIINAIEDTIFYTTIWVGREMTGGKKTKKANETLV